MLGYDRSALLEMDVTEFSADEPAFSQAEAQERVRRAMKEGPQTFEWRFDPKDGAEFWVEVHLKRTVINGQTQVLAMTRDVSERKEGERKLAESEQRYRTLAEHFPNGAVAMYDEDLRYTLAEGVALGDTLPPRTYWRAAGYQRCTPTTRSPPSNRCSGPPSRTARSVARPSGPTGDTGACGRRRCATAMETCSPG